MLLNPYFHTLVLHNVRPVACKKMRRDKFRTLFLTFPHFESKSKNDVICENPLSSLPSNVCLMRGARPGARASLGAKASLGNIFVFTADHRCGSTASLALTACGRLVSEQDVSGEGSSSHDVGTAWFAISEHFACIFTVSGGRGGDL